MDRWRAILSTFHALIGHFSHTFKCKGKQNWLSPYLHFVVDRFRPKRMQKTSSTVFYLVRPRRVSLVQTVKINTTHKVWHYRFCSLDFIHPYQSPGSDLHSFIYWAAWNAAGGLKSRPPPLNQSSIARGPPSFRERTQGRQARKSAWGVAPSQSEALGGDISTWLETWLGQGQHEASSCPFLL